MTKSQIYSGNKTIAMYEGWRLDYIQKGNPARRIKRFRMHNPLNKLSDTYCSVDYYGSRKKTEETLWKNLLSPSFGRAGNYHLSWNSLLPVWFRFQDELIWDSKSSYLMAFKNMFYTSLDRQSITGCWHALVKGIEWLNEQKKK